MCGLTGFVATDLPTTDELLHSVRRMRETLVHRGPDAAGEWLDASNGVAS